MIVSLSWLEDYVSIQMDVSSLADALTMVGLEVEAVWDRFTYLNTVVAGRIDSVSPHPKADKLTICKVNTGDRQLDIVCGAPNARKGMLAPLAFPGTVFPNGKTLENSVIRGIKSEGMLCSENELGLGSQTGGLMELHGNFQPGTLLAKALSLSDHVMEIGLTPNRPDCLSILGIAREIAAIRKTELKYPDFSIHDKSKEIFKATSVTIEAPEHCPRYCARLVENISIGPSPFWMQDRLLSVGLRPINAIVDITNFVMMETGQPLHAFDFDRLAQNRIVVRTAKDKEVFTTLDGKRRELNSETLMICDGEKPVAIGGVMGGENSEIQQNTTRVLIESACFDPVSIRKTSKYLGLSTDASHRFERGVDPDGTVKALNRAASLMSDISGGHIVPGLIDENPIQFEPQSIKLNTTNANRVLGLSLQASHMQELLESVGFLVQSEDSQQLVVTPPSFRVDVSRPQDLMEEIARIYGYDQIPTTFPLIPAQRRIPSVQWDFRGRIKDLMQSLGFNEVINYSFMDDKACDLLELDANDKRRKILPILNPLNEDMAVMRTCLISGLLRTMHLNLSQQMKTLRIFEVGNTFISQGKDSLPEENEYLAALWTGSRSDHSLHMKDAECDFYDIKGAAEALLRSLEIQEVVFTKMPENSCQYTKAGHNARILSEGKDIGLLGEIDPKVISAFDLKQKAFIFELDLKIMSFLTPKTKQFQPVPRFPATYRDVTIIIDKHIESGEVLEMVRNTNDPLIESVLLYDLYEGDPIPKGHKSITLRIVYRSAEKTLEDIDVTPVTERIAKELLNRLNASLPG
jgi:phenylalanyl-tRNA synthetase beta chain